MCASNVLRQILWLFRKNDISDHYTYSVNVTEMSPREPIHFDVTYAETNRRRS